MGRFLELPPIPSDYVEPEQFSSVGEFAQKKIEAAGLPYEKMCVKLFGARKKTRSEQKRDAKLAAEEASKKQKKSYEMNEEQLKDEWEKKKHLLGAMKTDEPDWYDILGIGHLGFRATDKQIKKAHRKQSLVHHPDKVGHKDKKDGEDPHFLKIQKAFETLSNPQKRREFDSHRHFDESIPEDFDPEDDDYFETFWPVFESNARFSEVPSPPSLGDCDTPMKEVNKFYKFWFNFKSWRDFSKFNEYNLDEADCREEKRWMTQQNDKKQKKYKKQERERIISLVRLAESFDPRIIAMKKEQEDQAKERKEAKAQAKREKEEARLAEIKAKEDAERQAAEDIKRRAENEKRERKYQKDLLKSARKRLRTAQKGIEGLGNDSVEFLCGKLEAMDLEDLAEELEEAEKEEAEIVLNAFVDRVKAEEKREEDKKQQLVEERRKKMEAEKKRVTKSKKSTWNEDEDACLAKAIAKYPGGSRSRWKCIAQYINHALRLSDEKTAEDCISRAKNIGRFDVVRGPTVAPEKDFARFQKTRRVTKNQKIDGPSNVKIAGPDGVDGLAEKKKKKKSSKTAAAAGGDKEKSDEVTEDGWSKTQQTQLEVAMRKHPATMKASERWSAIAAEVDGKNRKECVARFKEIRQKILNAKKTAAK
eukprot:TRINITY_DN3984_c0_g1_i1.p1 TRINITY_DN3984_c0_g1~~TRINITY_DN3984_c0_g1_i1.p1  ORF type:complete len:647 (-),score=322.00 TRINITY_DN3984_c0_g1_i1:247-2187(-)